MADPETRDLVNQAEAWLTQFHHTPEPAWAMVNELYIALSEAQQRLVTLTEELNMEKASADRANNRAARAEARLSVATRESEQLTTENQALRERERKAWEARGLLLSGTSHLGQRFFYFHGKPENYSSEDEAFEGYQRQQQKDRRLSPSPTPEEPRS